MDVLMNTNFSHIPRECPDNQSCAALYRAARRRLEYAFFRPLDINSDGFISHGDDYNNDNKISEEDQRLYEATAKDITHPVEE